MRLRRARINLQVGAVEVASRLLRCLPEKPTEAPRAVLAAAGPLACAHRTHPRSLDRSHLALFPIVMPIRPGDSWVITGPLSPVMMRLPVVVEKLLNRHHCRNEST